MCKKKTKDQQDYILYAQIIFLQTIDNSYKTMRNEVKFGISDKFVYERKDS